MSVFSRLLDSFLASWYYYFIPAIVFFLAIFKKSKPEDKEKLAKKHRMGVAKFFALLMCFTAIGRVTKHHIEIMDLLVLALWWGWTLWQSCQKTYNEGYRDGYDEAVGECENHGIKFPRIK